MSTTDEAMSNSDDGGQLRPGRRINRNVVVLGVLMGLVMCGASIAGGNAGQGFVMLGIMLAVAAIVGIGSRYSDTIALIADDVHEERHVHVHQRAALYTLNVVALAIVGGGVFEIAREGSAHPYFFLAAVGGVSYVVSLLVLSRRS